MITPNRIKTIRNTLNGLLVALIVAHTAHAADGTEVTGGDEGPIQTGLPALSSGSWTYRTFRALGTVAVDPKAFLRAKISETP